MRATVSSLLVGLSLALAIWPCTGRTQSDRDFVFTDLDGHLVVRFAGTAATGLSPIQADEILDAEFSRMIHDRLRADLIFEDEPQDPEWAASMEPLIAAHVEHAGPEFSDIAVECRAVSCRVILEQPGHWSVPEHQAVLETVQESLETFVAAHGQVFEPVFMITAYYKEHQIPHIKAFLQRIGRTATHRVDR